MRNQLTGLVLLTIRNLWATKTILALFIISTLVWIFLSFALNVEMVDGSLGGLQIFGQDVVSPDALQQEQLPGEEEDVAGQLLEQFVLAVESAVAGLAYWIGTLLALFAATPLFISMLERGHVELLLSKPYGRTTLLSGHTLGVLLMMFGLALYLFGAVWLVMSLKTGVWNASFLISIPILIGMFAVMHSIIVFVGSITESNALALLVAYAVIFLSIILAFHDNIVPGLGTVGSAIFLTFYHVIPNFSEVTGIISSLAQNEPIDSWYPFISSIAVGIVLYVGTAIYFHRRDF